MHVPVASSTLICLVFRRSSRCSMVDFFQLRMLMFSGAAWRTAMRCWGVAEGVQLVVADPDKPDDAQVKKSKGRPIICL